MAGPLPVDALFQYGPTALLAAYTLFLLSRVFLQLGSRPLFPPLPTGRGLLDNPPKVSIIVPARNCEGTIRRCLESLLDLDYTPKEVVVVEGGSSDGTRLLLGSYGDRVSVIDEGRLPEGWTGKNWACHLGHLSSDGDYLLFTDADTVHSRGSLTAAMRQLVDGDADLLSLTPRVEFSSSSEKLLLPLIFLTIQDTARRIGINDDRSGVAWAVGEYVLVGRENYSRAGGHERIMGAIDEDVQIAINARKAGLRVRLMDGWSVLSMTMYSSVGQLWGGFVRNFYGLAARSWRNFLETLARLLLYFVLPFALLAASALEFAIGRWPVSSLAPPTALVALSMAQTALYMRKLSLPLVHAFLTPLSSIVVLGIMVTSMLRCLAGAGVSWRGRSYRPPGDRASSGP